jgi:hypothetical protein
MIKVELENHKKLKVMVLKNERLCITYLSKIHPRWKINIATMMLNKIRFTNYIYFKLNNIRGKRDFSKNRFNCLECTVLGDFGVFFSVIYQHYTEAAYLR